MESIKIPGRLESKAVEGIVAYTSAIYDEIQNVNQAVINSHLNNRIQALDQKIDIVSGMSVIANPESTLIANPDVVYIWTNTTNNLSINLKAPSITSKVAVYSFFVHTGNNPNITITSNEGSVILPTDYSIAAATWCEIQVMYANGYFFVRHINY